MRQNLTWAIGYNSIALPIAARVFVSAFGFGLRPEIAALTMSGSSIIVALNAVLLKRLHLPGVAPAETIREAGEAVRFDAEGQPGKVEA